MSIIIKHDAPPIRLRQSVEALLPGEMLATDEASIKVLRTTVSRVRKTYPHRQFRTSVGEHGPTVWRTA